MIDLKLPLLATAALAVTPGILMASSHMDAPLITLDDAANTTDVYAFVTTGANGEKYLTTALSVYPFEEPGIGPNKYNFDDNVLYGLHVSTGNDLPLGRPTFSYWFEFDTTYKNDATILQSYTGVVQNVDDGAQNLTQRYSVRAFDHRWNQGWGLRNLGTGVVPPNNQGKATPEYNLQAGDGPAKDGVGSSAMLDRYTTQSIKSLDHGYVAFAGQREDGFYGDINAIFDLLSLRGPGEAEDAQHGYNVHTIVLQIPVNDIGGEMQQAGVFATTSRRKIKVNRRNGDPIEVGHWVQVGRQGNPLFCEGFIAISDKDKYNRESPRHDSALFSEYARTPELAALLNAIVFAGNPIAGIENNRTDLEGIFIPDVIKVDLSTAAVPLAGGGANHPSNPDDPGFSRLSIFGGDTTYSPLVCGPVPSGWPNGRRFGDDVVDIGVSAVISDLRVTPPVINVAGDNVDSNDAVYHKVMPYAATPMNGRNHEHH
tara:strand:+ start:12731 stop:14182 length:1452 start_codon:yes stop_codon:yes gene_type:complete